MYRLGTEGILGLRRSGASLRVDPCIPADWDGYGISYRYGRTCYSIRVENPAHVSRGVKTMVLDGQVLDSGVIPLQDDGRLHEVTVELG
jgi:cellobiose phosphorylase